jgi:hypothetical protein
VNVSQNKKKATEKKVEPPKLQQTFPFRMMQIRHNMLIWKENIKLLKQNVRRGQDSNDSTDGLVVGSCEHCDEP